MRVGAPFRKVVTCNRNRASWAVVSDAICEGISDERRA